MNALILLLDNDSEFAYLIERYCETIGWKVTRANNLPEAFVQIQKQKPAMILLDLLLPPYGGWEALRALKQSLEAGNIPVTVYSSIQEEERAWGEGADFCLWKPVMYEEFLATLEAAKLFSAQGHEKEGNT